MMTSCDVLLVDRIDEKFDELDLYEKGGVTYIKIALDEMFTISNIVVATLQGLFEAFAKDGIAKVPNEDVHTATEQNWGKLTLKHCRNWQRDSFDYACSEKTSQATSGLSP